MSAAAVTPASYMRMSAEDMRLRGRAFWSPFPEIQDGDPVNMHAVMEAKQESFLTAYANDPTIPISMAIPALIDPALTRKAVMDPFYSLDDWRTDVLRSVQKFTDELDVGRKALTSASGLIHATYDADVTMLFKRAYPVTTIFGTESARGKVVTWDAIGPWDGATARFISEDPDPLESDFTSGTPIDYVKILGTFGKVTKFGQEAAAASIPTRDLMAIRTLAANEAIQSLRERAILGVTRNTRSAATAFENVGAGAGVLAYRGIYELMHANTAAPNYVSVAGLGINSQDKLDPYIDQVLENMMDDGLTPDVIISDMRTFNFYRRDLNQFFRSENMKETNMGVGKINLVTAVGTLPWIPAPFLPHITGDNGSMFILDSAGIVMRKLWGETYEDLANQNGNKRFMVSAAEVPVDKTNYTDACDSSLQGGIFGIAI